MKKRERGRLWWWILLIVLLAGLGFYLFSEVGRKPEKILVTQKVAPVEVEPKALREEPPGITGEKVEVAEEIKEEKASAKTLLEEDNCTQLEEEISEFFHYLDKMKYIQHLYPDTNTSARVKEILIRLAAQPPIPAGEGIDPKMIIGNIYHFYRVLDHKDLRLIRQVIRNEHDTMEITMFMFYRWFILAQRCDDPQNLRPSMEVLYPYAGFFLNTIGGRAYLSRLASSIRLLVSYYSLLIVHEADKKRKNNYGIDIFPLISPLKKEISYYPDFQFKNDYIERLHQMQIYYLQKR